MNNFAINNIEEKITHSIRDLINDFECYPDKYLTESDVRCLLFKKLAEFQKFIEPQQTKDGSCSIPLHTEVRWYGKSGKLKWRSDIVIVDVSSLRVRNNIFRLPSKGYGFNKPLAIIEVKLRRINGSSDNLFFEKIHKDIARLSKILKELSWNCCCYLVILDKKRSIEGKLQTIGGKSKVKFFYKYSEINHQTNQNQRTQTPN